MTSTPNSCYVSHYYVSNPEFINMNNTCITCSLHSYVHTIRESSAIVCKQLYIRAHKWSSRGIRSSPYHPAVCRACGSPPHTCAAPPQRCEPQWRRRLSKGCRGCRCWEVALQIREAPGGHPPILGSDALTQQHPHLKTRDKIFAIFVNMLLLSQILHYGLMHEKGISGFIFSVCGFLFSWINLRFVLFLCHIEASFSMDSDPIVQIIRPI